MDGSKFLIKLKGSFLGMLKFDPRLMICIYCSDSDSEHTCQPAEEAADLNPFA